jgi:hypothetical protein
VKQWATEQDWDSRRTGVGVDVDHASRLHIGWVELHGAVFGKVDCYTVQLQEVRDNLDVADVRNVAQFARGVAE